MGSTARGTRRASARIRGVRSWRTRGGERLWVCGTQRVGNCRTEPVAQFFGRKADDGHVSDFAIRIAHGGAVPIQLRLGRRRGPRSVTEHVDRYVMEHEA